MSLKPRVTGPQQGPLINEKIRFERLQVISADGQNLGVLTRERALQEAQRAELDLVIVTDAGADGIPIARIMDFGKATYAKKKKLAEAKKNQKIIKVKEIRMSPKIGEHDYQTKVNQGIGFLKHGDKLKVTLEFRGREMATKNERGGEMFERIDKSFAESGLTGILHEGDSKLGRFWSRVYYVKSK